MEIQTDTPSIIEKLSANNYLGEGSVGLVPFQVYSTSGIELLTSINKYFYQTQYAQVNSIFVTREFSDRQTNSVDHVNFVLDNVKGPTKVDVVSPETFILKGNIGEESFLKRLPFIFYNLAERKRQEMGMITVHAAAVAKDDKGILIVGDKGAGKTSLMLAFCLNQGFKIIGNDMIVISGKENPLLVSGSRQINVRLPVAKTFGLDTSNVNAIKNDGIAYEIKYPFLPADLGIETMYKPVNISAIVRINIHSENPDFVCNQDFQKDTEALRLNENLSRYIRGLPTPLELSSDGVDGYFPDMDTENLSEFRNLTLKRLLSKQYFYAAGNNPIVVSSNISKLI